jgi:hypothetical protein
MTACHAHRAGCVRLSIAARRGGAARRPQPRDRTERQRQSNLYRALRLLADVAQGCAIASLAGLPIPGGSVFDHDPEIKRDRR